MPAPRTGPAPCRLARGHLSERCPEHGVEPVPASAPPRRRPGDVLDTETGLLGAGHQLAALGSLPTVPDPPVETVAAGPVLGHRAAPPAPAQVSCCSSVGAGIEFPRGYWQQPRSSSSGA